MSVDAHVWLFADLKREFTEGSSFIDPEPNTERTNKNLHTHGLLQLIKMVIDSKIGTECTKLQWSIYARESFQQECGQKLKS